MIKEVEKLITSIRESHPDMRELYMEGQCYNFHLILRSVYPNAIAWYDYAEGHVYTQIGLYFYDIRGRHFKLSRFSSVLCHKSSHRPHRWSLSDKRRFYDSNTIITIKNKKIHSILSKISRLLDSICNIYNKK